MHHAFWYIYFFDVHHTTTVYGVKLLMRLWRTWIHNNEFSFLFLNLDTTLIKNKNSTAGKELPALFTKLRGSKQTFSLPWSSLRKLPNNLGLNHTIRSKRFWANANYFLRILIIYASEMKPRGNTFYKLLKPPKLEPVCYTTPRFTVSG